MPREDRLITFDYNEVYQAVYSLCTQKQIKKPPQGTLKGVDHPEGDTSRVMLHFYDESYAEENSEEYSRDFFAAALMLYCRGLGIPLPKTAQKSVLIGEDDVALRVRIG